MIRRVDQYYRIYARVLRHSFSEADEFEPLCADLETARTNCWNPVEVADHQGCHFHGALSLYYHAPPMTWSGDCRDGKAEGDGVLEDNLGNRSEGHLVAGMKDGEWTTRHADGGVVTEAHVEGTAHGLWTFRLFGLWRSVLHGELQG